VERLNAAQPAALIGHATKLAELAREQGAGRLRLRLRAVTSISEMLIAEDREVISVAFGVPVINMFVSTERLVGHSDPGGQVLTFASDTCIAECVDEAGRPVPDGTTSARVLLTDAGLDDAALAAAVEQSLRQAGVAGRALQRAGSAGGFGERGVAEQVDPDRYAADGGGFPAYEGAVRARLPGDHEIVARVLQVPAELLYLAKRGGRTRRGAAPVSAAEPRAPGVTAHLELDLEERLARVLRGGGGAGRSGQEGVALTLLLRRFGLRGGGRLRAGLLSLALEACGFSLLGVLEHVIPARRRQERA
jgi:hypothetical protein